MNNKTVSIKRIFERLNSDFGFTDIPYSDVIEWVGDILLKYGNHSQLKADVEEVTIEDGRGKIPCNIHSIIQCIKVGRDSNTSVSVPKIFFIDSNDLILDNGQYDFSSLNVSFKNNDSELYPMRWSTDTFHKRFHLSNYDFNNQSGYTYTLNNNYIFTNFESGKILISGIYIPVDDEGLPMLTEGEWFSAALHESAYKIGLKLWIQGEITDKVYNKLEQERNWYLSQAMTSRTKKNYDQLESETNRRKVMNKSSGGHGTFFRNYQLPNNYR